MIKIKEIKEIRERLKLTHIVIFGVSEDGMQHVATHGKTKGQAIEASVFGNNLKKELGWPEKTQKSKPLERICENCDYWIIKRTDPGYRIPDPWPGKCAFEPQFVLRNHNDRACQYFEPNQ